MDEQADNKETKIAGRLHTLLGVIEKHWGEDFVTRVANRVCCSHLLDEEGKTYHTETLRDLLESDKIIALSFDRIFTRYGMLSAADVISERLPTTQRTSDRTLGELRQFR